MTIQEKQLGQSRPGDTTAVSVYSPSTQTTTIIKTIFVTNTSGAAATCRLFVDDDGTTYNETTAIVWDMNIPADDILSIDTFIAMNNANGNFAVRTSIADALTFTLFGAEIT